MITVNVTKQGNFPVNSKKIKDTVKKTLEENGIVSDSVVDVAVVGEKQMEELNEKYYKDKVNMHPVFSFTETESNGFVLPPDGKLHLGNIVISYTMAVETAREKNKLIDEVICDLAEHASLHLVGIHHD